MDIRVKRVYAKPEAGDGLRVLVDRIWPRGLKKEVAGIDWWPREIAPSSGLRQWFGHEPAKWDEFRERYFRELDGQTEMVAELRERAGKGPLTLVFGARDEEHNNAVALREYMKGKGSK